VQASPSSIVVTVVQQPARQTTLGDVVFGALGIAGVLLLLALLLGAVFSSLLLVWNRRHPPEDRHLPSVSPLTSRPDVHRSSPAR
jgi:hypothetical protein